MNNLQPPPPLPPTEADPEKPLGPDLRRTDSSLLARFVVATVVGGIAAWLLFAGGVMWLIGHYLHQEPPPLLANAVPFLGPAIIMMAGIVLALSPRRRSTGLGLVCSVPLAALITFTVCGVLR